MEITDSELVHFTPGAIRQLVKLYTGDHLLPEDVLRIGVEGGGCAGLSYILQFDKVKQGDLHLTVEGLSLVMDKAHSLYLTGITVDYQEGLNARGFTYHNPNAQSTCGCGSSFGI